MWATNSFLQCHYVETDELVTSVTFDETESSCGPERTLAYDRRDAARPRRACEHNAEMMSIGNHAQRSDGCREAKRTSTRDCSGQPATVQLQVLMMRADQALTGERTADKALVARVACELAALLTTRAC